MKFKDIAINAVVTFFGSGYIRPLSATWGSLASGIVLFTFWPFVDPWIKGLIMVITFIVGVALSNYVERRDKMKDPKYIVIDEVVGMMIVTFFLGQVWQHWMIAFVLFRIFDVAKIWPSSIFDRRKGGFALMIDDVIMALPALAFTQLFVPLISA